MDQSFFVNIGLEKRKCVMDLILYLLRVGTLLFVCLSDEDLLALISLGGRGGEGEIGMRGERERERK